jgi:two-component system, cell cycle response regulator
LIADHPFQFESSPVNLTISIGIACMSGDMAITPAGLLKTADENLYQAKRAGRDRVVA